jgi:hypothetical protein
MFACPRCGNKNPFGNIRCATCGLVLDKETALKLETAERQTGKVLEQKNVELQTRLEKLEGAISALLTAQQSKTS